MTEFKRISTILIWSEDFRKLADWYRDVLGLKVVEELDHPQDTGVLFEFPSGGPWLWIGQHSQVTGINPYTHRHMFNISVDSVSETFEYLKSKNVKILAEPFKAPTFDKYFCTFYDLDDNLIQIIGDK
jgi:catechol 2,3-dioxygenase-like lactoylglutathione lyase family enzyme